MDLVRIDCGTCTAPRSRCDGCVLATFVGMPSRALAAEQSPSEGIAGVPGWSLDRVGPDGWPADDHGLPLTESEHVVLDRFVAAGLVSPADAASATVTLEPGAWRAVSAG